MTVDADAVGRLIRYALDPRLTPARDRDYADLLREVRNDAGFAAAFRATAAGQGLEILSIDLILGVTLAAGGAPGAPEESPYAMRLSDYARRDDEDRLLHALIHLAIAATTYPTAAALDEDRLPTVNAGEIVDITVRLAERLRERLGAGDPPADEPGLEPLYRFLLRNPVTKTTGDARAHHATITGAVRRALGWLQAHGFADKVDGPVPDTFRLRTRYRIHVRDAATYVGTELDRVRAETGA